MHTSFNQIAKCLFHLVRIDPVIGRARVLLLVAADVSPVFYPCDVAGIAEACITTRSLIFIKLDKIAFFDKESAEFIVFSL